VEGHSDDPGNVDLLPPGATNLPLLRIALIFYGVVFALIVAWSLWSGDSIFYVSPEAQSRGPAPARDTVVGLAAAAALIYLSDEVTRRTRWGEAFARELAAQIGRRSLRDCILLALVSGLVEEAFFRGALQPRLGLVLASLIFGLAHLVPKRELLPWAGIAIGMGFLLGGLFIATGNLVAPVVTHIGVNAVNLKRLGDRYG
jgi:membrane protease YdiL (CAAX protease family)